MKSLASQTKKHNKMSVNKVILLGNLGKDPELKTLDGGNQVCNFSLATTEKYKDKEYTEWHNIVVWGKLAEVAAKYLHKGSKLYLEGKIKTESYEKDGQKVYTTKIVATTFTMLDKKDSNNPGTSDDDGMPF